MSICAVIPAAGRGTRLGSDTPKILTPITNDRAVWDLLHEKLAALVDHVHLVMSPEASRLFPPLPPECSVSIQPEPKGMGDAIFRGWEIWSRYDAILIVWGDQLLVSRDTIKRSFAALRPGRSAVLPVTRMAKPYVEYVFEQDRLTQVRQSREGDTTTPNGFSDVGTFLLNTAGLMSAWTNYLAGMEFGHTTGEINFLPFLPFLSARGWSFTPLEVADSDEARGLNTPHDLAFIRDRYEKLLR